MHNIKISCLMGDPKLNPKCETGRHHVHGEYRVTIWWRPWRQHISGLLIELDWAIGDEGLQAKANNYRSAEKDEPDI